MKMLRRGIALVLSIALVFSLVAVVASPNWTNTTSLGLLSRYYETGKTNTDVEAAKMISTVAGDPGGKSYGAFMFASKAGTVKSFVDWCLSTTTNTVAYAIGEKLSTAYYSGGEGCGPLFDQAWLEVAEIYGDSFFTVQEDFSKSQIYDKTIALITGTSDGRSEGVGFKVEDYSVALKNVIWSRAVHHGPSGAASIVKDAFASLGGFAHQSESEIIMAIYEQSGTVVADYSGAEEMEGSLAAKYNVDGKVLRYWYGSSSGVQLAVYRRLHVNEPADALSMLQANAFVGAPLSEGNYTISLKGSSLALGTSVTDGVAAAKIVNTSDSNVSSAKFTLNYLSGLGAYTISTTVTDANNNVTTLRLVAVSGANSGDFGAVILATPSTSDSQLWYIDGNGYIKNKAVENAYLAYKNDKLVMVGIEGTDVSQSVTVIASSNAANKMVVTGQTTVEENNTTTTKSVGPNVTYIADEYGTFKTDETLALTRVTSENATTYTLGTLPTLTPATGYEFIGWFTADGTTSVSTETDVPADGLTLHAKYTKTTTSKIEPSCWTFTSVVADASDFTVQQLIYPDSNTKLHDGDSSFPVRGMISCSGEISNVTLAIKDKATEKNISNCTRSVDLDGVSFYDLSELDSSIYYSTLSAGKYTYTLTATVSGKVITLKTSDFSVDTATTSSGSTSSGSSSENTVTVTFNAGSNGSCTTTSKTYSLDNVIYGTLPSVTANSGYGFAGWFTAPTGGVEVLPGTQIVAENITLYAQYTKIYTYTFLKANGNTYDSGSAAAGTVFTTPSSAPTKSPDSSYTYTFSHWVDTAGNKYTSSQAIVMGESNMTFTPVYTAKAYSSGGTSSGGTSSGGTSSGGTSSGGTSSGGTTSTPSGVYWTVTPGSSVSEIDGTVYSNGSVVSSGSVGTGMTVKTDSGEYTIAVTGDMSGDGKITVTDVVKLQSHLLNKTSLSGAYLEAADLNNDGKVSITDLVKSARVVAGKDTIG